MWDAGPGLYSSEQAADGNPAHLVVTCQHQEFKAKDAMEQLQQKVHKVKVKNDDLEKYGRHYSVHIQGITQFGNDDTYYCSGKILA